MLTNQEQFDLDQDITIDRAISYSPSNEDCNLSIIWDKNEGEELDGNIYPYPTYYNTNDSDSMNRLLKEDLLDNGFDPDDIQKLFQKAQKYEISDLLQNFLGKDYWVASGENCHDLDNIYYNYFKK